MNSPHHHCITTSSMRYLATYITCITPPLSRWSILYYPHPPLCPHSRIRVLKLPRKCWAGRSRGSCSCVLVVWRQILNFLVGLTCLICPPLLILWKCCDMRHTLNGELTKIICCKTKKEAVTNISLEIWFRSRQCLFVFTFFKPNLSRANCWCKLRGAIRA